MLAEFSGDAFQYWENFERAGIVKFIASDPKRQRRLFKEVLKMPLQPNASLIIDSYFSGISQSAATIFFDIKSLDEYNHPINIAFAGATFTTPSSKYFLDILKVFLKHGLTADGLRVSSEKRHKDFLRACNLCNTSFLVEVVPRLGQLPTKLLTAIVGNMKEGPKLVQFLVDECEMPIQVFQKQVIRRAAHRDVANMITWLDTEHRRELGKTRSLRR